MGGTALFEEIPMVIFNEAFWTEGQRLASLHSLNPREMERLLELAASIVFLWGLTRADLVRMSANEVMEHIEQATGPLPAFPPSFIPTLPWAIRPFLELAAVTAEDVLYDLGCGDATVLIQAAARGARCVGVEMDPAMVARAETAIAACNAGGLVTIQEGDCCLVDLTPATVVYTYLSPAINRELAPKFKRELRPGSRIVSQFAMGEWKPDKHVRLFGNVDLFLWVVGGVDGATVEAGALSAT